VSVVTYGETREFPAFFSRHSGHKAPYNVTSPSEAATMIGTFSRTLYSVLMSFSHSKRRALHNDASFVYGILCASLICLSFIPLHIDLFIFCSFRITIIFIHLSKSLYFDVAPFVFKKQDVEISKFFIF